MIATFFDGLDELYHRAKFGEELELIRTQVYGALN